MLSNIYKYLIEVATLTIPTLCIFMEAGFACLSYECVALAIIVLSYTDIHQSSYAIDEQRDYTAIVWDPGGPYRSTINVQRVIHCESKLTSCGTYRFCGSHSAF